MRTEDDGSTEQESPEHECNRLVGLIGQTMTAYTSTRAPIDARNLSLWRGNHWQNEGTGAALGRETAQYQAQRNEIFPAIDSITSSLALDLPQCEAIDHRAIGYSIPTRGRGRTQVGRRLASVLNWFASLDDLDILTRELVLLAEVFDAGGIVKTVWSPQGNRVKWRTRMPWEVHFDPNAKRIADAQWSFERFPLHIDDFNARVKTGVYERPRQRIVADTYPRDLVAESLSYDEDEVLKRQGIKDQVTLIEFWDYRRGLLFHIHPDTRSVLSRTPMPYSRPYELLVFHPGINRLRGVSDVTHMAATQRDINELTSARREIVQRLPRRMLMSRDLWIDDTAFERFKNAKTWEPALVEGMDLAKLADKVFVTPPMDTTFDFNKHRDEDIEHIRYIAGSASYQRGAVANIRTAAEVDALRGSDDARMTVRVNLVTKVVRSMFERGAECLKWAIENADVSGIKLDEIVEATMADVETSMFAREVATTTPSFRVLPFSPGMEDKNVRRRHLIDLLKLAAAVPQFAAAVDWLEVAREAFELFGLPPECVLPVVPPEPPAPAPAEPVAPPAPTEPELEAPPEAMPPGIDPQAILAALARAAPGVPGMAPDIMQMLGGAQG